jgi:hypothetical protein
MTVRHFERTLSQPIALFSIRPTQTSLEIGMHLNEDKPSDFQKYRDGELFEAMREVTDF